MKSKKFKNLEEVRNWIIENLEPAMVQHPLSNSTAFWNLPESLVTNWVYSAEFEENSGNIIGDYVREVIIFSGYSEGKVFYYLKYNTLGDDMIGYAGNTNIPIISENSLFSFQKHSTNSGSFSNPEFIPKIYKKITEPKFEYNTTSNGSAFSRSIEIVCVSLMRKFDGRSYKNIVELPGRKYAIISYVEGDAYYFDSLKFREISEREAYDYIQKWKIED